MPAPIQTGSAQPGPGPADRLGIRLARPADAEAWVNTHVESLCSTYAELMPAEFCRHHRSLIPQLIIERTAQFAEQHRPGAEPATRAWIAEDDHGPLAIAAAGRGGTEWELARGFPPASTDLELHKLYALPRALGRGVGQAMLDTVIGQQPAYLWVMAGNPRAEAFYRRNGFVPDGLESRGGPTWHYKPMFRMHRLVQPASGQATRAGLVLGLGHAPRAHRTGCASRRSSSSPATRAGGRRTGRTARR